MFHKRFLVIAILVVAYAYVSYAFFSFQCSVVFLLSTLVITQIFSLDFKILSVKDTLPKKSGSKILCFGYGSWDSDFFIDKVSLFNIKLHGWFNNSEVKTGDLLVKFTNQNKVRLISIYRVKSIKYVDGDHTNMFEAKVVPVTSITQLSREEKLTVKCYGGIISTHLHSKSEGRVL